MSQLRRVLLLVVVALLVAPAGAGAVDTSMIHVAGEGVVSITFGADDTEVINFRVAAKGTEVLPLDEIPATGQLHAETVQPFGPHWELDGSAICIRDLSPFVDAGVWEVRFVADQSTNAFVPAGKMASLYVKDAPGGDAGGWLGPSISWDDPNCGPRGGIDIRPLQSGDVRLALGTFADDDTTVFEESIEWLAAEGMTKGCNPPANTRYCPDAFVTRGQMAAFLRRALG